MNSSLTTDNSATSTRPERLRVVDVGRWLWVVTVVVLLLGFLVLRELSGVQDAPHVEPTDSVQLQPDRSPATLPGDERIHTLHPVTSQETIAPPGFDDAPSMGLREPTLINEAWPGLTEGVETASEAPIIK